MSSCEAVGGFDLCLDQALRLSRLDLKLRSSPCPRCEGPVLDEAGAITSFCTKCSYVWLSEYVHNPLADYIQLDEDLIDEFDIAF